MPSQDVGDLDLPDLLIVVSPHAVQALSQTSLLPSLVGIPCLAVGATTAKALVQYNISALVPEEETSEGLLAMLGHRTLGKDEQVWILAGVAGRGLIDQYLRDEMLVRVVKFELYERINRVVDLASVERCDVICFASVSAVTACVANVVDQPDFATIFQRPVVVASQRIAHAAVGYGFVNVTLATGASAQAMLAAVQQVA